MLWRFVAGKPHQNRTAPSSKSAKAAKAAGRRSLAFPHPKRQNTAKFGVALLLP
jgi:hypothetical protein